VPDSQISRGEAIVITMSKQGHAVRGQARTKLAAAG